MNKEEFVRKVYSDRYVDKFIDKVNLLGTNKKVNPYNLIIARLSSSIIIFIIILFLLNLFFNLFLKNLIFYFGFNYYIIIIRAITFFDYIRFIR